MAEQAARLLSVADEAVSEVLGALRGGNDTRILYTAPGTGLTTLAVSFSNSTLAQASGEFVLPISDATVVVPVSMFTSLGIQEDVAMVVTLFNMSTISDLKASGYEVRSVVSIDVVSLQRNTTIAVNGLVDPVRIYIPTNYTTGLECAYWDNQLGTWSTAGVTVSRNSTLNSALVCETRHLSLFGAIFRGFVSTFECSQASLLNAESISLLLKGDWYQGTGSVIFFIVLGSLLATLVGGAYIDYMRRDAGAWSDEHFLIPIYDGPAKEGEERELGEEPAEEEQEQEEEQPPSGRVAVLCCAVFGCFVCCCTWLKESSAFRDALDDLLSNWISNFGEIRDFLEGFWEGLDCGAFSAAEGGGRMAILSHRVMSSLVVSSSRRATAATLGVSDDVVAFMLEDEDLQEVLMSCREQPAAGGPSAESEGQRPMPARRRSAGEIRRIEDWVILHKDMVGKMHSLVGNHRSWLSLPGRTLKLFLVQNPFGAALVFDIFTSCKMRALFLMTDILGSMLLCSIFFQASGTIGGKRNHINCATEDPWEQVGRLMAIGLVSLFIAGLPTIILQSLHTRGFKRLEYEGCPEWKRQLKVWHTQDLLIWIFGSIYVGFITFFICVLLANIDIDDHLDWAMGVAISVVESTIVIPLSVALMVPFFGGVMLHASSRLRGKTRSEALNDVQCKLHNGTTMMLPVTSI